MPSSPKMPAQPSVADTVAGQAQQNKDAVGTQQTANMTDQSTPYGTINYTANGLDANGNPSYSAKTQLSPEQQAILNQLQGTQTTLGAAGGNLATNTAGMYSQAPDFSEAAGTQTKINMDRQLGYLQPYFKQQTDNLDNQLRNQGLTPGTPAYDNAIRTVRDNQNQSVMSFLNNTQGQAFNQAQTQYEEPLNTVGKIMGGTQPANLNANLTTTPQVTVAPANQIAAQQNYNTYAQAQYQAQLQQHNAMMTGLFGAGSTLLGMPGVGSSIGGAIGGMMIPSWG